MAEEAEVAPEEAAARRPAQEEAAVVEEAGGSGAGPASELSSDRRSQPGSPW